MALLSFGALALAPTRLLAQPDEARNDQALEQLLESLTKIGRTPRGLEEAAGALETATGQARRELDGVTEQIERAGGELEKASARRMALARRLAALEAALNLIEGAPFTLRSSKDVGAEPVLGGRGVTQADRDFWSYRPLSDAEPPAIQNAEWARTPIDRFIGARLAEKGIEPNPPADRRKLIRRAYFDLIGLAPKPEEVEAFIADPDPLAYEKLIDRLLASPRHGERWARHWLDLARFAESHGFEHDYDREYAYHYRDFVIEAFNRDLPYDTFVKWQLAGDELAPEEPLAMMATGFLAAGVHSTQITKNQVEKERYDELDDMARTMGTAMLGMTIGCARCHDHKYDPISMRDYYRLLSTFTTTVRAEVDVDVGPEAYRQAKAKYDREHEPYLKRLARFEKEKLPERFERWLESEKKDEAGEGGGEILQILQSSEGTRLNEKQRAAALEWYRTIDPERKKLNDRLAEHAKKEPKPDAVKVLIASEGVEAVRLHTQGGDFLEQTHFLRRGDPNQKLGVATQGFPAVLVRAPEAEERWQLMPPKGGSASFRRASLAGWITDVEYGAGHLLARVIVNRLWQHHMGRGIVATPSDFGHQGSPPTHPELLDWLAGELIRNDWRLKPIHRLIVTSAVYRQTADRPAEKVVADESNAYFWHYPRRRLEAEIVRDAMLWAAGELDEEMFGPGTLDPNHKRRSIYFTVKRSRLVPMMTLFDAPDALGGMPARQTTTVAPQALALMNNEQVRGYARAFAARIAPKEGEDIGTAVARGYLIAFGRPPQESEPYEAVKFLARQARAYETDGNENPAEQALADFCQALLGANEFVYVD